MYPWVLSRSPCPQICPPRTAQHLSALAPSAGQLSANHLRTGRLRLPSSVATRKVPKLPNAHDTSFVCKVTIEWFVTRQVPTRDLEISAAPDIFPSLDGCGHRRADRPAKPFARLWQGVRRAPISWGHEENLSCCMLRGVYFQLANSKLRVQSSGKN